jgi:hypothetical protein
MPPRRPKDSREAGGGMFGWFRVPKKIVDGRAMPELTQKAEVADLQAGVVVVVREDAAAAGRRLPDGRVVTYEMPGREDS